MKFAGVRRDTTDLAQDESQAHYAENARLSIEGELRRRRGMSRTSIEKQGTAILGFMPANPNRDPYVVMLGGSGNLEGYSGSTLNGAWGDAQLKAPTGSITIPTGDARGQKTWDMAALAVYGQTDGYAVGDAVSPSLTADVTKRFTVAITWTAVRVRNNIAASGPVSAQVGAYFFHTYNPSPTAVGTAYSDAGADAANWSDATPDETNSGTFRISVFGASLDETISLTQTYTNVPGNAELYPGAYGDWTDGPGATFPDDYPQDWEITGTVTATFTQTSPDPSSGQYTISITRGDDFATSFDVYAKNGDYPLEAGDGIMVGNVTIDPDDDTVQTTWTPPTAGTWAFAAVARRGETVGPLGRIG